MSNKHVYRRIFANFRLLHSWNDDVVHATHHQMVHFHPSQTIHSSVHRYISMQFQNDTDCKTTKFPLHFDFIALPSDRQKYSVQIHVWYSMWQSRFAENWKRKLLYLLVFYLAFVFVLEKCIRTPAFCLFFCSFLLSLSITKLSLENSSSCLSSIYSKCVCAVYTMFESLLSIKIPN